MFGDVTYSSSLYRSLLPGLCCSCLFCLVGCGRSGDYQQVTPEDAARAEAYEHDHGHDHAHTAPHGGHLIELGDHEYNAEVVFEPEGRKLIVYLLDAHAENPAPVALETIEFAIEGGDPITLSAEPLEGEAEGRSSRFSASGDSISIDDIEELHGSLTIEINGKTYTGELKHDHDHGHDHE